MAAEIPGLLVSDRGPDNRVRYIELDRPESRNGLTVEIVAAMKDAVLATPESARAIVIHGRGGSFCSGLDLKAAMRMGPRPPEDTARDLREHFHGLIRSLVESTRPTIAAVDGAAAGVGCDLALACDIRVASERARFGEIFVKRGLMPDGGGTWLLPHIVGLGRALDLLYTGDVIDADHAMRIGLTTRQYPSASFAADVDALAAQIAGGPPLVNRLVKQSVYAGLSGDLNAALAREATGQLQCLGSKDFAEGITAFLMKREAKFTGA